MAKDTASEKDRSGSSNASDSNKPNGVSKEEKDKQVELSEEDRELKEKLDLLAHRAQDKDEGVRKLALEQIKNEIRSATSTMTSVPKPLKFLTDAYEPLKAMYFAYEKVKKSEVGKLMADVLSVMAMTMSTDRRGRETLKFKLKGEMNNIDIWGHEYVRHLAGEIGQEYADLRYLEERDQDYKMKEGEEEGDSFHGVTTNQLKTLVNQIVPFLMNSNAEAEAVDLMSELQMLESLPEVTDKHNFERVCLYLEAIAPFFPEPEDSAVFTTACKIYMQFNKPSHALQIALRLSNHDLVKSILDPKEDSSISLSSADRKQLFLDLGAACYFPKHGEEEELFEMKGIEEADKEVLEKLAFNRSLLKYYQRLAKELEVEEPKHPSDIYKQHLIDGTAAPSTNLSSSASSGSSSVPESARANLASTYVNAFVNAGFGTDRLMMASAADGEQNGESSDNNPGWVYRNRDHGMMAASASLGLIHLWDTEVGIDNIDKYMHANEEFVRAGALLGIGVINSRVRSEFDPAFALLSEHVTKQVEESGSREGLLEKIAAIAGIGIAYAGTDSESCKELLREFLGDREENATVAAMAAIALGLIGMGTEDEDLSFLLVQSISDRTYDSVDGGKSLINVLLPLALGLVYLGRGEAVDVVLETVTAMCEDDAGKQKNRDLAKVAPLVVESCAYAGTGSVMKIQKLLSIVGKHEKADKDETEKDEDKSKSKADSKFATSKAEAGEGGSGEGSASNDANGTANGPSAQNSDTASEADKGDDKNESKASSSASESPEDSKDDDAQLFAAEQACAVLGLAMISMGEDIGSEMIQRLYGHLLHYGEPAVKKAVPIAIGLTSISNPQISYMELLSKLSHDSDAEVAQNAIFGLGLIGAGTNNSRIANMLRQLSVYYQKDAASLFLVRIAQALLHAGKGLVSLSPYHGSGRGVLNKVGLAGLLVVLYASLDMKSTLLGKSHYLLYFLSITIYPRMLFTVDDQGEFLPTTVRVGQAVDTVGQAGRPKRITGFQTHSTPVLLSAGERAELGTEEYLGLAASLQDIVILRKNPEHVEVDLEAIANDNAMEIDEAKQPAASASAS